jgi:short subunit dehydrogenase-like uncharacterized protein
MRNVLQMQVVQTQLHHIVLRVVARPQFGPNDAAQLEANARARLRPEMTIGVECVERLETTRQGKTPYVIRCVPA